MNDVAAIYRRVYIGHLIFADRYAALLNEPSRLTVGRAQLCRNEHGDDRGHLYRNFHFGKLPAASEGSLGLRHGLLSFLLAVHEFGKLVCEHFLLFIYAAVVPLLHLGNLIERNEGEHLYALHDVGVVYVAPVLVELVWRGLVFVKPYCALGCLAHLLALAVEQQGDRHGIGVFAALLADKLGAGEHVAPLVVAAELHVAAVVLVQIPEVVCLHYHVVELEEGKALLHALLVALCTQHVVYRKARAHFAQEIDIVEL